MKVERIRTIFCIILIGGCLSCLVGCSSKDRYAVGAVQYETTIVANEGITIEEESAYGVAYDFQEQEKESEVEIRINQIGYKEHQEKIAVVMDSRGAELFDVVDGSGNVVYTGKLLPSTESTSAYDTLRYADFSDFSLEGTYYVMCGDEVSSYPFEITDQVYSEAIEEKQELFSGWILDGKITRHSLEVIMACANLLVAEELFGNRIQALEVEGKNESLESVLLEEVKTGIEWLLTMQNSETGEVYNKIGEVYEADEQPVIYTSSTNVTASFCAVMAMASRIYKGRDEELSSQCLAASKSAWSYLEQHGEVIVFENPEGVTTKTYQDDKDSDERYWAAAELFKTTNEAKYYSTIRQFVVSEVTTDFRIKEVSGYGNLAYLTTDIAYIHQDLIDIIKASIYTQVSEMRIGEKKEIYRVNFDGQGKRNVNKVINEALTLVLMGHVLEDTEMIEEAYAYSDYLFGVNPYAYNYMEYAMKETDNSIWMTFYSAMFSILVGIS